jgi:acyl-CoA synthetase (NDP forming)
MEYLGACPNTKVIALYIEGITRGRKFMETARAIALQKPIVALYVGGSETGRRAGLSHTGAIAGPDGIYDGIFHQSGIVRAQNLSELFDFCLALGTLPRPTGNRVIVQTNSGGPGAVAADSLGRSGFTLTSLSPSIIRKLRTIIPKTASINNPVDTTFSKLPMTDFHRIMNILLEEENADMLLVYFFAPDVMIGRELQELGIPEDLIREEIQKRIPLIIETFFSLTQTYDKPIIGYTYRSLRERMLKSLLERGVPIYPGPERAARALAALLKYYTWRDRLLEENMVPWE